VNLPETPEQSLIMGSLGDVEEFDRRSGQWVSMVRNGPVSQTGGPLGGGGPTHVLLPFESSCNSLLVKTTYGPSEFVLPRCASWGLFVADRSRAYFEALASPLQGTQRGKVAVRRTPETLVMLSCVMSALRRTNTPPTWQKLAAHLRSAWQDHGGGFYRMAAETWSDVLDMVEPYLDVEFLENVSILIRRYDGAPLLLSPTNGRHSSSSELVFSLEFRINYVDLSECNVRHWDPQAHERSQHGRSSSPPSALSFLPAPPPSPVINDAEDLSKALRELRDSPGG
jgi:hypothetical protein